VATLVLAHFPHPRPTDRGPGLITSPRYVDISHTQPDKVAQITAPLKAPTYDCSSIAYFKMVDADGALCFPDSYQLGLDVLVRVEGQRAEVDSLRLDVMPG
jgi:hypothetical protein